MRKCVLSSKFILIFKRLVLEAKRHYRFIFLVTQIILSLSISGVRRLNFTFKSDNMFSIKMVTFCKSANCPSSQKLLSFQNGETTKTDSQKIREHLSGCEFCAAEVEFYAHYPQSEETIVEVDIPLPLYELAEALLSNKHKEYSLLNKLLSETDSVKI